MKKILPILSPLLCLGLLSGCVGTTVVYTDCPQSTPAVEESAVKTGLAMTLVPTVDNTAGSADFDLSLAAVLVGEDGVILECLLDGVSASVQFDENLTITTPDVSLSTKQELGFDYGMSAGGATGEWFQQADALAEFARGKTISQVKAGLAGGYARDADLASAATIYLGSLVEAMEKAVSGAKALGAARGDVLKLTSINSLSSGGLNCDAIFLTQREGVITSCCLDGLQATLDAAEGTLSPGNTRTKNELGEDYGMVAWGGATYEWFRQAENFAAYVTGKTPAQVAGIAITPEGKASDPVLASSVTISIAGFQALVAKAA